MKGPLVVINVNGGIVQDVFAPIPDLRVIVVDWDVDEFDNPAQVELELQGENCSAAVIDLPVSPLEELAGSDAEQAIDAACEQGILSDNLSSSGTSEPPWSATSETRRFVVYDPDSGSLLTTEVFNSVNAAAEWSSQAKDVLVLPIGVTVCTA